ncbi:MAG: patatin-like phospholipase family protein [Holosporaceae bacterium]|jgi:predicted acylesterase/phospholipase RssA|nr:patatin-like phospholipase family protein [Holosporaceae bacterium]
MIESRKIVLGFSVSLLCALFSDAFTLPEDEMGGLSSLKRSGSDSQLGKASPPRVRAAASNFSKRMVLPKSPAPGSFLTVGIPVQGSSGGFVLPMLVAGGQPSESPKRLNWSFSTVTIASELPRKPALSISNPPVFFDCFPGKTQTRLVLSIDGGGSRGIIPAYILKALGDSIGEFIHSNRGGIIPEGYTQEPLKAYFDLVAGTSVGALVGAAVVLGKEEDMYENFPEYARKIFGKKHYFRKTFGKRTANPKYKKSGRLSVVEKFTDSLEDEVPEGEREDGASGLKMSSFQQPYFVVPFCCYNTGEPRVVESFDKHNDFYLHDVLMMTSAAPTFFRPHHSTDTKTEDEFSGGDGGIFANNPTLIAYCSAKKKFKDDNIILISLGTGSANNCTSIDKYDFLGKLEWAKKYPELSLLVGAIHVHNLVRYFAQGDERVKYHRLAINNLRDEFSGMDGTSDEFFENLTSSIRASINPGGTFHSVFEDIEKAVNDRVLQRAQEWATEQTARAQVTQAAAGE